ncbi:hypothetical protein MMC28_001253 [Mycoblastus sanguinarius]|nr:hypothetical protein [Mycoblastus sanguinarius]
MLIYINYIYQTYIVGDFKAYPEPVAAKLRRALYYSNIDIQPKNAVKYYRQALALSDEMGLDPFSDEILGVKIQLASFFEKIHMYQKAVDVLEIVRGDCLRWLEQLGGKPGNERKRTKVLGKTIGISIRLGDYYSDAQIDNQEAAEERLVWAVTAMLKEQKRRENGGVKEGDEQWMSNEEIGGALESLGSHYEAKNQHYLAAPLFLQALGLCPATSCHSVVLSSSSSISILLALANLPLTVNNLAVSLAQQNPPPSLAPNQPPAAAASNLSSARQWALKSLALAASIKPPERNEECDEGCAVATINLGDFAAMEGDIAEAKRRYEEGKGISKGIGFRRGVQRVEEVLRGVEKKI